MTVSCNVRVDLNNRAKAQTVSSPPAGDRLFFWPIAFQNSHDAILGAAQASEIPEPFPPRRADLCYGGSRLANFSR
jgi:hypothetical protein